MTELFALNVRNIDVTDQLVDRISLRRKEFIYRVKNENAKKLCLGAGLILAKLVGIDEKEDKNGRPFAEGNRYFSVSHSSDIVFVAVSDERVGADVEKIKDIDVLKLAKRSMTDFEYSAIENSVNIKKEFYKLWTKKESFVKMLGTGFDKDPSEIEVLNRKDCKFITYEQNDYVFSVCFNGDIDKTVKFFETGDLI